MMQYSIRGFRMLRKHESVWKVLGLVVGLATCCAGESKKWTTDDLTTSKFPHNVSNDIYRDPRKSDAFVGDIALSRLEHDVYEKELEEEEAREHERELAKLLAKNATELDTKGGTQQRRRKREKESDACGGVIENLTGTIESPSFPNLYPPNKICIWEIKAPPYHEIYLNFTDFDLEASTECKFDRVTISSKNANDEVKNLGVFCGSILPSPITSAYNYLRIEFRSDESFVRSGFRGNFFTDACGGVIEMPTGTIESPSFPNLYPRNKICIWEIKAPPQHKIYLNFTDFDLEDDYECEYDSVTISSKFANNEVRNIGVFCGSSLPSLITSAYNYLRIEFHSDAFFVGRGFRAYFFTDIDECATNNDGCQQICNNTIGSYLCSCHNGYELHENLHNCEDIDECVTNNGGCQQICNNTIGSYICSCRNGYELHENLHDCEDRVTEVASSGCSKCDLTRLAFHVFLLYLCLRH